MKTAQQICDAIDGLFGNTRRSKEATLADMRKIAKRAGAFAALGDDGDDDDDDDYCAAAAA